MYLRQVGDTYGIGSYRHEPLLLAAEAIRPGGAACTRRARLHPRALRRAAEETARLLPAVGARAARARVQRPHVVHARRHPAPRRAARPAACGWCEAIWVTHAGGAGEALAELMVDGEAGLDLHECDPERFDDHGLSPALRPRPRGAAVPRGLRRHPPARAVARRAPAARRPFYARQLALGAEIFESAGWERPQWYEANGAARRPHGPARSAWARALVADRRRRAPRHPRAGRRSSTSRRSRRSRCAARGLGVPPAPGRQRHRPARRARSSTRRCSRRAAAIMCDLTVTRVGDDELPRRHRRRGRQARPRAGCAATCPGDGSVAAATTRRRACAASGSGARGRATSSPRVARTTSRTRPSRT